MSEQHYEILLHDVDADINTYECAQDLSRLFKTNSKQLEIKLVKVKLSTGSAETLVSKLTYDKAEASQIILSSLGLKTSIKESKVLVSRQGVTKKSMFTCPACGFKQESKDKTNIQLCSACGVIKQKYEEAQSLKKIEQEAFKQQDRSIWKKGIYNKIQGSLISMLFVLITIGVVLYIYIDSSDKNYEHIYIENQKADNNVQETPSISMQSNQQEINNEREEQEYFKDLLDSQPEKRAAPIVSKVSVSKRVKKINKLLALTKLKPNDSRQSSPKEKPPIYRTKESQTDSFDDEIARNDVKQKVAWKKLIKDLEAVDNTDSLLREGEVVEVVAQIKDNYLKAVALNTIMKSQFDRDIEEARAIKKRIKELSQINKNKLPKKILIYGIYAQGVMLFDHKEEREKILKNISVSVNNIKSPISRIMTLIQLSKDQREGSNLELAEYFLNDAYQKLKGGILSFEKQDKLYKVLAIQYAKLFDFTQANLIVSKISNHEKRVLTTKEIFLIEAKSSVNELKNISEKAVLDTLNSDSKKVSSAVSM